MQFKISVRHAGIAAVVLSVLMGIVLVSYDESLKKLNEYVHKDCGMPDDICPVKNAVPVQALPAFLIDAGIFGLGLFLIFYDKASEETAIAVKKKFSFNVKSLATEEKKIFSLLETEEGGAFQSDIVEKSGLSKVSVSRILDKLEAKGLIERRRRGMSNFVILKGIAE